MGGLQACKSSNNRATDLRVVGLIIMPIISIVMICLIISITLAIVDSHR